MGCMTPTLSKICRRCQETKLNDCFGWSGYIKKDGNKSSCSYCKTCQNELRVERKYGFNYKQYLELLKQQNNCCGNLGCQAKNPGAPGRSRFYIDHCHVTGKIRGLLCHHCNLALGQVNDNIQKLEGLIQYLKNS